MEEVLTSNEYVIRKMTMADVPGARSIFISHDHLTDSCDSIQTYLRTDCNGFYVAIDKNNDQVIGVCGGPFTRPDMAFIGLYAVDRQYFGRKIGQKLFNYVLEHIGHRNACLLTDTDKLVLYRDRLGFGLQSEHKMIRYFGNSFVKTDDKNSVKIKPIISDRLVNEVIEYDQQIHRINREKLLTLSLREANCQALAALDPLTDRIVGFGCIRSHTSKGCILSPVYANDYQIAKQLIQSLINGNEFALKTGFIYYTISTNESAIRVAEELKFEKQKENYLLFRNTIIDIDYQKIYSIISPNFSL